MGSWPEAHRRSPMRRRGGLLAEECPGSLGDGERGGFAEFSLDGDRVEAAAGYERALHHMAEAGRPTRPTSGASWLTQGAGQGAGRDRGAPKVELTPRDDTG